MDDARVKRVRSKTRKQTGDHLLALLAYEATDEARALLKKYRREDAQNVVDLEIKLASLYKDANDKLEIEKDFAEIHPHKNWLFRTLKPMEKEGGSATTRIDDTVKEAASSASGQQTTAQQQYIERKCCACGCGADGYSGFDGRRPIPNVQSRQVLELATLVAVIGLTYHFLKHQ